MPSSDTQFQPGTDERRVATQFGEGNDFRLTHGLWSEQLLDQLPAEAWVIIPPTASLDMLLENLVALRRGASDILKELGLARRPDTIEIVPMYHQITIRLTELIGKIEGNQLKAGKYGDITPEVAEDHKAQFAKDLSVVLTKLQHAVEFMLQWGVTEQYYDKKGELHAKLRFGMLKGLAGAYASSVKSLEKWAQLLTWELKRKKGPGIDDVMGRVIRGD